MRFPPFTPHTPCIPLPQIAVGGSLHQSMAPAIPAWSVTSSPGGTGPKERCQCLGKPVVQGKAAVDARIRFVPSTAAFRGGAACPDALVGVRPAGS